MLKVGQLWKSSKTSHAFLILHIDYMRDKLLSYNLQSKSISIADFDIEKVEQNLKDYNWRLLCE